MQHFCNSFLVFLELRGIVVTINSSCAEFYTIFCCTQFYFLVIFRNTTNFIFQHIFCYFLLFFRYSVLFFVFPSFF